MHLRRIFIAALAIAAGACSQQDKKPRLAQRRVVGVWQSDTVSPADGRTSVYELRTSPQGMVAFVVTRPEGDSLVARGTWDGADSLLRVVVRLDTGIPRPTSILFAIRGNVLAATSLSGPALGPDPLATGLLLRRR
jgi:hypothetical protein